MKTHAEQIHAILDEAHRVACNALCIEADWLFQEPTACRDAYKVAKAKAAATRQALNDHCTQMARAA